MKYLGSLLPIRIHNFFTKILHKHNQSKSEHIVNQFNDTLIRLRNSVNKNEIFENTNADEVININELTFDFDKNVKE